MNVVSPRAECEMVLVCFVRRGGQNTSAHDNIIQCKDVCSLGSGVQHSGFGSILVLEVPVGDLGAYCFGTPAQRS